MNITRISTIDWDVALERLSPGAFFLLNIMYRSKLPISDKSLMVRTGFGLSTHRKQKRELLDCNYVVIKQVGRGIYKYYLGEEVADDTN